MRTPRSRNLTGPMAEAMATLRHGPLFRGSRQWRRSGFPAVHDATITALLRRGLAERRRTAQGVTMIVATEGGRYVAQAPAPTRDREREARDLHERIAP